MSYLPSPQIHVWWVQYISPKEAFCWLRKKLFYIQSTLKQNVLGGVTWASWVPNQPGLLICQIWRDKYLLMLDVHILPLKGASQRGFKKDFQCSVPECWQFCAQKESLKRSSTFPWGKVCSEFVKTVSVPRAVTGLWEPHTAFCSFAGLNFRRSRFAITWIGSLLSASESVLFRGETLFWGYALIYA